MCDNMAQYPLILEKKEFTHLISQIIVHPYNFLHSYKNDWEISQFC